MDILSNPSNLKCSKHPKNQITFIKVNQIQDNKNMLYCEQCMLHDRTFLMINFVQLKQIIEYSNNSQIINLPPVDDKTLQDQIYNIQTQDKRSISLVLQINKYFDNLKTEVLSKIQQCQKEMMSNVSQFSQYEDQIQKKLEEFQMADQFKNILLNSKIEINEKENQYREFINKVHEQKDNYTKELKQMFENLNKKEQQIEFESPLEIKTKILQMIEKINFFKKENNQTNITMQNQQNIQPEYKIVQNKTIDLLPDLILHKSNYNQSKSQNLQMQKLENNSIQVISQYDCGGSYYSNLTLDRNKKYVFRFQFKTVKKNNESFSIGLIRDSTKDEINCLHDKLSCCFFYSNVNNGLYPRYGIDKCIKGDLKDTSKIDCMELRVCIKDEILEIVDYPHYNHKYALTDIFKNNLRTYQNLRLGIFLQNDVEVTLINAHVCEHFQN